MTAKKETTKQDSVTPPELPKPKANTPPTTKEVAKKRTTNQERPERKPDGKFMPGVPPNPKGIGGFQERPQDRSDGRWSKEGSISYNYNKLMRMTPEEVEEFVPNTMAEKIAKQRVQDSVKSLNDAKEVTDRTEGKAPQFIGLGGDSEYTQALVRFVGGDDDDETE